MVESADTPWIFRSSERKIVTKLKSIVDYKVPIPENIVESILRKTERYFCLAQVASVEFNLIQEWRVMARGAGARQDLIDAKSNDFSHLLGEALEGAGRILDKKAESAREPLRLEGKILTMYGPAEIVACVGCGVLMARHIKSGFVCSTCLYKEKVVPRAAPVHLGPPEDDEKEMDDDE